MRWSIKKALRFAFFALSPRRQIIGGQTRAQRFDTQPAKQRMLRLLRMRHHDHEAEPARVIVDDARAVREMQHDVIVRRNWSDGIGIIARRIAPAILQNRKPARHAEMHDQIIAARQSGNQIFRAPLKADDLLPDHPLAEALGKRKPEIGAAHFESRNAAAGNNRR